MSDPNDFALSPMMWSEWVCVRRCSAGTVNVFDLGAVNSSTRMAYGSTKEWYGVPGGMEEEITEDDGHKRRTTRGKDATQAT